MSHLCAQMSGSDVQTKDKIYQKETSQCTLNIKLKYEQPLLGLHSFLVKFKSRDYTAFLENEHEASSA